MSTKFDALIKLLETSMASGAGSVFGTLQANPTPQFSSDFYAPGDTRIPMFTYGKGKSKKRKGKKVPMLRRNLMRGL